MATARGTAGDSDELWQAVDRGDTGAVRRLIKHGVDLNCTDRKGKLLFDVALSQGQLEVAQILRDAGARGKHDMEQEFVLRRLLEFVYDRAVANRQGEAVRLLEALGANSKNDLDVKLVRQVLQKLGIEVPEQASVTELFWEHDKELRKPLERRFCFGLLLLAVLTAAPFVFHKVVPNAFANIPIGPAGCAVIAFLCTALYVGWTWWAIALLPGSEMRSDKEKASKTFAREQQQEKAREENLVRRGFNTYTREEAGLVSCHCGEVILKETGKKWEQKSKDGTRVTMRTFICGACGKEFSAECTHYSKRYTLT